jgi:hypothetical protein
VAGGSACTAAAGGTSVKRSRRPPRPAHLAGYALRKVRRAPEAQALLQRYALSSLTPRLDAALAEHKPDCCIVCDTPLTGTQRVTCSTPCREQHASRVLVADYHRQAALLGRILVAAMSVHPPLFHEVLLAC